MKTVSSALEYSYKVNKEASDLLALMGGHISSSKLVWQELQAIFAAAAKSKSSMKFKFHSSTAEKELRYKVLGLQGHGLRLQESGSKAPPPVAYRVLGLDSTIAVSLLETQARKGLARGNILQGLGLLLLLRDGPGRARELLLDEGLSAESRKDHKVLLARYADGWREARLYGGSRDLTERHASRTGLGVSLPDA